MINWASVDTVLLDMDGTLLDLHFDNHFWLEHVPRRYSARHGLTLEQAREDIVRRYRAVEGTLNWYCLDYWTRELALDICALKNELQHLIGWRPHAREFLQALRLRAKRTVLVTNAHGKALQLKLARTGLDRYLDAVVCAHDLGLPKEDVEFWQRLQQVQPFERETAVLIDDSLAVLQSARRYGIAQLIAVARPDSQKPRRDIREFTAIEHLSEIFPDAAI